MLDHAYQFSTRKIDIFRMNEDNGKVENEIVPDVEELAIKEAREERTRM